MPERPLLILPAHADPEARAKRIGGGPSLQGPGPGRQGARLAPRFTELQKALDARRASIRVEAGGIVPEEVVVLETVGAVEDFLGAVAKVPGLDWLSELDDNDLPPDDDFFIVDKDGQRRDDRPLSGRLFLVFVNHEGLRQILSLWDMWLVGRALPRGLAKWGHVFALLRDVRTWSAKDRLFETGVLDDWKERVAHDQERVPVEIELWFRQDARRRTTAAERVKSLVQEAGGEVVGEAMIEPIGYHAMMAHLSISAVQTFLSAAGNDAALVQCEQIQFFRAAGQMVASVDRGTPMEDSAFPPDAPSELGDPIVALLDGLPLQNHRWLAGRLVVDDPDNLGSDYPTLQRRHGTAMASLILHGDAETGHRPLSRRIYVRPILRPDQRDWRTPHEETVGEQVLLVDLVHRAVRRFFEDDRGGPPVAPQICVVNLSIGIRDRPFHNSLSPLARLLDWLAWRYGVLFIVSAGNHGHPIKIPIPPAQVPAAPPAELEDRVMVAVAADARHRRLLSPAEAVNALTVAASHSDAYRGPLPSGAIDPLVTAGLPSPTNAQGMGYRRAIKPDMLLAGGRSSLRPSSITPNGSTTTLEVLNYNRGPGQRVAAPGPAEGELGHARYCRGTSNAAALASRGASELYDVLEELRSYPGGELIDSVPRAVWLKVLLAHSARWGDAGDRLEKVLRTKANGRQFKAYLTRLLGLGGADIDLVRECARHRVTALGGGSIKVDQAHLHRFPLPPSLSGHGVWRRLVVTLAWLTPINPTHKAWRRADLWFEAPGPQGALRVKREEADWRAVQRGTLQHEVLEGSSLVLFEDGETLAIRVNCRADAGALDDAVPYALAATLEIADSVDIDIYDEVRVRLRAAQIVPTR